VFKSYGNDGQWDHDLPTESDSWGATWSMKRGFRRDVMWQNLKNTLLLSKEPVSFHAIRGAIATICAFI
jgi:hypothetical protein